MSDSMGWTNRVIRADGTVDVDAMAGSLLVTKADLAAATGLSLGDAPEGSQECSEAAQRRFLALTRILNRTAPWTGHPRIAFAWYRSQPLPSFGDMTAEDLLKMDRAAAVEAYLARIEAGGYA